MYEDQIKMNEMEEKYIVVVCPSCKETILIDTNQIRCGIFRHAVFKDTMKPVHPHLSQKKCEALVKKKRVIGCCKPFRITPEYEAIACDYL